MENRTGQNMEDDMEIGLLGKQGSLGVHGFLGTLG